MKIKSSIRILAALVVLLFLAISTLFAIQATGADGANYASRNDVIYHSAGDIVPDWWQEGAKSATLYWLWEIRSVYVPDAIGFRLVRADTTLISADTTFQF